VHRDFVAGRRRPLVLTSEPRRGAERGRARPSFWLARRHGDHPNGDGGRGREPLSARARESAARALEFVTAEDGGQVEVVAVTGALRRVETATLSVGRVAGAAAWDAIRRQRRRGWTWLRTDGAGRLRRARRAVRRASPKVLVTTVVGGTAVGVLVAALAANLSTFAHVATYRSTTERLRPLSLPSTVYASNGAPLAALGLEDRQPVRFDDLPAVLVNAVVATEDHTFWTNPGVDPAGLVRAFVDDVGSGRVRQGGSTITQQLVKTRILDPRRDLQKKVTESVLALRLNRRMSKRQIFTEYVNTVYFGEGAYGVQSAAARFFLTQDPGATAPRGKEPRELTLPEAALLAGLIANPSGFDPFTHPVPARARRHDVLQRMVAEGYATPVQAAAADLVPLPAVPPPAPDLRPRDLWVAEVQQRLLADPRLGATLRDRVQLVLRGGLRVVTTLDPTAQFLAQSSIGSVLPNQPPFTAAIVSMDPTTGKVRAMAGGPGFERLQYNLATHPPGRQPGSTYKVVTLAAALEAGYSPDDTVNGSSPCSAFRPGFPPWSTVNAEPGGGTLSLRDAAVNSVNCAFAHVIASLGPPAVVSMAHRLGITGPVPAYLPITLGVAEATPLDMATVVSTLADEGVRHTPTFIERVVGPDGKVYIDNTQPAGQRVLDPAVADCETDILRGVIQRGTGTRAQLPGRDAAGKTGTTDDHGDAWFIGFTPQLATAVWMGATTGRVPMTDVGGIDVFGGTYPAEIWQAYMSAELAGQPAPPLPAPGPVCARPGAPISDPGRGAPGGVGG
jgi:membrane peptidoglycan carboxypeptidase